MHKKIAILYSSLVMALVSINTALAASAANVNAEANTQPNIQVNKQPNTQPNIVLIMVDDLGYEAITANDALAFIRTL